MKSGLCSYITGYTDGGAILFQAEVGGRNVGVIVQQDKIKRLVEILKHTNHVGHAAWHLQNPESPMPCSTCAHDWKEERAA